MGTTPAQLLVLPEGGGWFSFPKSVLPFPCRRHPAALLGREEEEGLGA